MKRFALGYEFLARIVLMVLVAHVAMVVHTLAGLVVGGFFPSLAACHTLYRTWLLDEDDRSWSAVRSWQVFHRAWKGELLAANRFGWPQALLWALLLWEYWFVQRNDLGVAGFAVSGILLAVNVAYALFVMASWAVRANFDEPTRWVVRTAVMMVVARPLCSLMLAAVTALVAFAYWKLPGLGVALGLALPVFAALAVIYSWGRLPGMDVRDGRTGRPSRAGSGA